MHRTFKQQLLFMIIIFPLLFMEKLQQITVVQGQKLKHF